MYEQTLRKWSQVSTHWHLQVHLYLEHFQWGREFKTKANNAAAHIQAQHRRLKLPLEVEDSVNTVLKHMLCFPANQQTCMAGIKYLWSALLRPSPGVSVRIFTDIQTCSVLSVAMRTMRLHGYQYFCSPKIIVLSKILFSKILIFLKSKIIVLSKICKRALQTFGRL